MESEGGGPNLMGLVDTKDVCAQKKGFVKSQQEGGYSGGSVCVP